MESEYHGPAASAITLPGLLSVMIGWRIHSSKRRGLALNDFEDGGRDSRESRRIGRLVLVLQGTWCSVQCDYCGFLSMVMGMVIVLVMDPCTNHLIVGSWDLPNKRI